MKKLRIYFLVMFSIFFCFATAQTFEEYQKQEQEKLKRFANTEKEGIERLQKEYADYVSKRDKEWTEYLRREWTNFAVFSGKKLPEIPKPKIAPVCKTSAINNLTVAESPVIKTNISAEIISAAPNPQPVDPIRKPAEEKSNTSLTTLSIYGRSFSIPYDPALRLCNLTAVNQEAIANFWEKTSATNYTPAVEKLLQAKTDLNINDYGYYLLTKQFAQNLFPNNANSARLITWFMLVRSGYGVRIAFQNAEVALLIPTLQQIYLTNYLTLSGVNYYIFPKLDGANYSTYDKDFNAAGRSMDFNISSPINFAGRKTEKVLSFEFEGKPYHVSMFYDPDLIDFYKDYPLVDINVYLNATVSVQAKESLAAALKPLTAEMDELKAVNFILHFVQTAFAYKTDPEQFGREKPFFAEEVFYYPFCDCEDRAVLFTYLVREILGLRVVGLEYPEHMASAVEFTAPEPGDYLVYKNNRYVVSDPTYINAPAGMAMPQFKTVSPKVYEIKSHTADDLNEEKQWAIAEKLGLYKGSSRKNSKLLNDGSIVLSGYFSKPVQFGSQFLTGTINTNNCFVAKVDKDGQVVWAKTIAASGNAVGMSVETDPAGNVVVAGVYTGTLQAGGKTLKAPDGTADLFMAGFSPSGNLVWINRGGLEALPKSASTAFSVSLDANGQNIRTNHAAEEIEEQNQGLFVDNRGNIIYSGMTNNALALAGNDKPVAFAAEASVNVIDLLRIEGEKYIAQKGDKAISGLFAAIRLVKYMGLSLTGAQTQQALDKNNPNFKKSCPNIYKNLGMINFVQNSKGVITIQTENGRDISFDKVKITNNSRISIAELPGSDLRIDVLSGIKVGKLVVWYNLNYIKMLLKNGNLMFDYSTDHSQATVNVQNDILN
ncbi:MAG: hypothetical protein WC542_05925 [Paludibacter sp.]